MEEQLGKVTIAPNVLVTIVQKTADSVAGIARLSDGVPAVKRLLGLHTVGQGVEVSVVDDRVGVVQLDELGIVHVAEGRIVPDELVHDDRVLDRIARGVRGNIRATRAGVERCVIVGIDVIVTVAVGTDTILV